MLQHHAVSRDSQPAKGMKEGILTCFGGWRACRSSLQWLPGALGSKEPPCSQPPFSHPRAPHRQGRLDWKQNTRCSKPNLCKVSIKPYVPLLERSPKLTLVDIRCNNLAAPGPALLLGEDKAVCRTGTGRKHQPCTKVSVQEHATLSTRMAHRRPQQFCALQSNNDGRERGLGLTTA